MKTNDSRNFSKGYNVFMGRGTNLQAKNLKSSGSLREPERRVPETNAWEQGFIDYMNEFFDDLEVRLEKSRTNNSKQSKHLTFKQEDGPDLFLEFESFETSIHILNIRASDPGSGFGTEILDSIKEYAEENQKVVFAEDVKNIDHFSKHHFEPSIDDPDNPYGYEAQWFYQP